MDLSNLDIRAAAETGAECHLEHPVTGEKLYGDDGGAISLTLCGSDAREFRKAAMAYAEKNAGRKKISIEAYEAHAIDLLVVATKGWKNLSYKGQKLEFTPENVRMVYSEVPWVREQADTFIGDRSNFLQRAKTS